MEGEAPAKPLGSAGASPSTARYTSVKCALEAFDLNDITNRVRLFQYRSRIGHGAIFSPDGRFAADSDYAKRTIEVWKTSDWSNYRSLKTESPWKFELIGDRIKLADHDGRSRVWLFAEDRLIDNGPAM